MFLGLVLLIPPNPEKSLEAVSVYEGLRLERIAQEANPNPNPNPNPKQEAEEEESRKEEKSNRNLLREHTPSEVSNFLREHTPSFVLAKVGLRSSTKGTAAGSEMGWPPVPDGARCSTRGGAQPTPAGGA